MLKALLRVRFQALFSSMFVKAQRKKRSPLAKVGYGLLILYVLVCLVFVVGVMCVQLLPLAEAGLGWLYFALMAVSALAFCIIGGSFAAKSTIFEARDNELLLSMPLSPGAILFSRLLPLLVLNLAYGGMFLAPAGVIFFWEMGGTVPQVLLYIVGALLVILLGTAVSALFGWLLSILTSRSRHKNLLSMVFSLAFLGAYFYFYSNMSVYMQKLLANGATVAESIRRVLPPAYHFGMASLGSASSLLLLALWCLLPAAAAFLLLQRSFLRIMTEKRGAARIRYQAAAMPARSPFAALFFKEARRFLSSSTYMMNCGLGAIMMVGGAAVLAFKGTSLLGSMGVAGGEALTGVLACVLGFCAIMINPTACSISLEGSSFSLLRAMPLRARDYFGAKLALPLTFGLPACVISCLVGGLALRLPAVQLLGLLVLSCALVVWTAVFGLAANLMFPKLDWISEMTVIKQSMSTFLAIFGGMGFVAVPALVYLLLLQGAVSLTVYLWCVAAVFLLMSGIVWRLLMTWGVRRLNAL